MISKLAWWWISPWFWKVINHESLSPGMIMEKRNHQDKEKKLFLIECCADYSNIFQQLIILETHFSSKFYNFCNKRIISAKKQGSTQFFLQAIFPKIAHFLKFQNNFVLCKWWNWQQERYESCLYQSFEGKMILY